MTLPLRHATAILLLCLVLPASADDQQKLQKQAKKMSAMAADPVGRRIVNMSMADALKMSRNALVLERHRMNLNYGSIYMVHALTSTGAKIEYIGAQLESGKTIAQVGNELHANWKQMVADAKKLNRQIEENLYQHFVDSSRDLARDEAEHYQLRYDGVPPDNDVNYSELAEAQSIYAFWQTQAEQDARRSGRLDIVKENAARADSARDGNLHRSKAGLAAPAAGGLPND
jgi:hypothetical protein